MNFEDQLRATMRAHEEEAPRGLHVPVRPRRPRGRVWLPIAAAAAVAIGAVALSVTHTRHDGSAPASGPASSSCPSRATPGTTVPSAPDDIASDRRLVPDAVPRSVIVCSFVRRNGGSGPVITGRRELTGDLAAVADTLTFVPRRVFQPCLSILLPTDHDQFLIRLTYRSGTVWVAAPRNHCSGSSNGAFDSHVNISAFARAAAAAGHWVTDVTPGKLRGQCNPIGAGRLGEDTSLVPDGPTGLTICSDAGRRPAVTPIRTDFRSLVTALQRARTRPSDNGCRGEPGTTYSLRFTYARGPDTRVTLTSGCHPELNNRTRQGDDTGGTILTSVRQLVAAN